MPVNLYKEAYPKNNNKLKLKAGKNTLHGMYRIKKMRIRKRTRNRSKAYYNKHLTKCQSENMKLRYRIMFLDYRRMLEE